MPSCEAVAGAFEDAWNQRDAQRVADVLTEDAVMENPGAPEAVLRGRSAIRAYFESWRRAFPDAQMCREVLFTPLDGGEYASRWRIWGTMEHDLQPPGFAVHQRVETEGVAIIELRGSLVSRCRQFYDTTQVARQLGAAPPRGSSARATRSDGTAPLGRADVARADPEHGEDESGSRGGRRRERIATRGTANPRTAPSREDEQPRGTVRHARDAPRNRVGPRPLIRVGAPVSVVLVPAAGRSESAGS